MSGLRIVHISTKCNHPCFTNLIVDQARAHHVAVIKIVLEREDNNKMQALYRHYGIQVFFIGASVDNGSLIVSAGKELDQLLSELVPDIIHVQAFLEEDFLVIFEALQGVKAKKLVTLHTHALFCPKAICFDGETACQMASFNQCACDMVKYKARASGNSVEKYNNDRVVRFRSMIDLFDKIICCSHWQMLKISELYGATDKLAVLYYGVNVCALGDFSLSRPKRHKPCFGYLGSLSHSKGVGSLIRAVQRLDQKKFTVLVSILFNNTGAQDFKYYLKLLRTMPAVQLMTLRTYKQYYPLFFSKIDYLIIPSLWEETGPMTLFESFAFKVPVIVFRRASLFEKINEGANALVYDTDNGLEAMMQRIMDGHAPAFREESFFVKNSEQYAQEINDVYQQCLAHE